MSKAEELGAFLRGFFTGKVSEEQVAPKQPEKAAPSPEDIAWEQQFKLKQCLKRMEKNIQTKEVERAKAFETVQKHLRAGANPVARIYAKNVAALDAGILRAHMQLSSVKILADKVQEGAFSAETTQLIGGMAEAIQSATSVSEVNDMLKKAAKVEELSSYLTEAMSDGTDLDVDSATEQILIQAGTGVVTEPGMNSGTAGAGVESASVAEQADNGLKDLSDLINGKQ